MESCDNNFVIIIVPLCEREMDMYEHFAERLFVKSHLPDKLLYVDGLDISYVLSTNTSIDIVKEDNVFEYGLFSEVIVNILLSFSTVSDVVTSLRRGIPMFMDVLKLFALLATM